MEASSREALVIAREHLVEVTQGATGLLGRARDRLTGQARVASEDELIPLADELFAVARLREGQPTLRRALSDPSGKPEERAALAQRLFASRLSPVALDVVQATVRQRWSRPLDVAEALATLATDVALDAAEARGELDDVEDELFRFARIVAGDRELSRILSDRNASSEGKGQLLDRLLSGRVSPVTERLLRNVLIGSHVGTAGVAIERLSDVASRRRGQSIARVTSAVALTAAQEQRLADVLGRLYGRTIGLQVTVDPTIVGGLLVQVGDEVIDGSIAHRLEAARRQLAG